MTQSKAKANQEMLHTLDALQDKLRSQWLDRSLPDDWNALDHWHPVRPHKTRVTLRLDTDMVRWFRKLGPNYGPRINDILRVYWTALLSGQIDSHFREDTTPQLMLAAAEMRRQMDKT